MEQHNPKTYLVLPELDAGMLSPEDLERLTALVRKYQIPMTKITGAQRIAFLGLEPEQLAAVQSELAIPATLPHTRNRLHYVQACPGSSWCKYGVADALGMGKRLKGLVLEMPLPSKVKVGVSGCRMCCCGSWLKDVGLTAEKGGWRFTFGGNGAGRPRIGDLVADSLADDEAVRLIKKTLHYFSSKAQFKTRSARFMERFGIDALKEAVL